METPLDFKIIPPIPYKKTVTLINSFVINTTEFLNKFSYLCEQKLAKVTSDIERLEITMNILEAKLASIPGLENTVQLKSQEEIPSGPAVSAYDPIPSPPPSMSNGIHSEEEKEDSENEEFEPAPPPPQSEKMKMKDDPRFKSYFNLVRLGAPIPQIKMQMQAQGLDPSILDNPEADAPGGLAAPQENGNNNGDNNEEAPPPPPMPVSNNTNNESESESSEED